MSYADEVRAYCVRHYVQSARAAGKTEFSIRAGDVHEDMGYKNRIPLVCSAIGASTFSENNGLLRLAVEGPLNGANTIFRFRLT
jgi:5-methylcytosine-specific restriction enzyme B